MPKLLVISMLIVVFIIGIGAGYAISPEYAKQSAMHTNNLGKADENYDAKFIDAMIEHHEGAIEMAEDAKMKSERTEVLNLAEEIINTQSTEIKMMMQWKEEWYGNN